MAKLRADDVADLDVRELEAVEYSTEQFDRYDGEVPPVGTELNAYVKRMWWTRSSNDDPMLKILTIAEENEGDNEQYNGCPFWLNAALIGSAKFRWDPFLQNFGISLRAIKARKVEVEDKEDQNGAPIISIDGFHPGEDHDEAWCRIITDQEAYNGSMQPRVREWLPWEDDEEGDDSEADDTSDEYEDDEYEDEEAEPEDEPDEAPAASPPRGRRGAARTATQSAPPARTGRKATSAPARPAASGSGRRGAKPAASAPARPARGSGKAAAAAPARGRGRRAADNNEPPF